MNTQNVKLDDVARAFAAIPATGTNTFFDGKVKSNVDLNTHIQGFAPYRGFHFLAQSDFGEPAGRLFVVDRSVGQRKLVASLTLPALSPTKPFYFHPGGCQIVGDCLVLPIETGNGHSAICFFDVSNPLAVREINPALRVRRDFHDAGAVGVTNFSASGKEYWLLCAYDNGAVDFYVSDTETFPGSFHIAFSLTLDETEFQSLFLLTDVSDRVFALGLHRSLAGRDLGTLFSVDLVNKKAAVLSERHFKTRGIDDPIGGGPHFRWGVGLEIVSTSQLALYCSGRRYDNRCQINAFQAAAAAVKARGVRATARKRRQPKKRSRRTS
jgi:hypothetical protein